MAITIIENPPAEAQLAKFLLYGAPGSGKTIAACGLPSPILYINCEGPDAVTTGRRLHAESRILEVRPETVDDLRAAVAFALDPRNEIESIALDTIGEAYKLVLSELSSSSPRPSLQNYGDSNVTIARLARTLRDAPLNVAILAHEEVLDNDDDRIVRPSTGGKKLPEEVMAMMSIVAYTAVVPAHEEKPKRYVGQLVEAKGRRAKDRSGVLGDVRDLDLGEWIAAIRGATTESAAVAAEKESK